MASAQHAYRLTDFEYAPARPARPDVRVLPGGRGRSQGVAPSLLLVANLAAVAMIVATLVCFFRIGFASAAVDSLMKGQELTAGIREARSMGNDLEITQTALSNSATIKSAATGMGMVAPEGVGSLSLEKDIVATDAQGALSLSGSIQNKIETQR
ncbi:cell division protein FtsL [Eggerthellaceae bacterium zg-997]|nr:cell division protein FtsL [Eggerthellaceae bacterium zg-997]